MLTDREILPRKNEVNILFVDDDYTTRELQTSVLRTLGHKVTGAEDAEAALLRIEEKTKFGMEFEIIFLDIQLPGTSGIEFCDTIRERCPNAWIVAFTARRDRESILAMLRAGANDYLTKPVSPEQLTIKTFVALYAQARMQSFKKRTKLLEKSIYKMAATTPKKKNRAD